VAGRIRDEDVEAVKERTDIVKLVSGYLSLKKTGHDSFSGLCPFHTEKTPSFSVSPAKGMYYCFGCGAGGDVIRFVREVEKLEFAEAVERLAKEAGVTLRYEGDSPADRRAAGRLQSLHRATRGGPHHASRGHEGEEARGYLEERGIDRAAAEAFGVGYAPRYPDFLLRRLARSLSTEVLVDAGLAIRDGEGNVRDRFRGRITFPVHDLSGRAVGIGARILPGARRSQCLNSPRDPRHRKAGVLYNLPAKAAIARTEVFVVENYRRHRDGVAGSDGGNTCGTALGEVTSGSPRGSPADGARVHSMRPARGRPSRHSVLRTTRSAGGLILPRARVADFCRASGARPP
jgi:DNA primase